MNKKTYMRASLEVVAFDAEDIITTSPGAEFGGPGTNTQMPEDGLMDLLDNNIF